MVVHACQFKTCMRLLAHAQSATRPAAKERSELNYDAAIRSLVTAGYGATQNVIDTLMQFRQT